MASIMQLVPAEMCQVTTARFTPGPDPLQSPFDPAQHGFPLCPRRRLGNPQGIEQLVRRRVVTLEAGLSYATNPGNLRIELADFGG